MAEEGKREYHVSDVATDEAYLDTIAVLIAPSAAKLSPLVIDKILDIELAASHIIETGPLSALAEGCYRNIGRITALRDVHTELFKQAET